MAGGAQRETKFGAAAFTATFSQHLVQETRLLLVSWSVLVVRRRGGLHGSSGRRGVSSRSWRISMLCVFDGSKRPEVGLQRSKRPHAHLASHRLVGWPT